MNDVDRLDELYELALSLYLRKTDFQPDEWLDKKDADEYTRLVTEVEG